MAMIKVVISSPGRCYPNCEYHDGKAWNIVSFDPATRRAYCWADFCCLVHARRFVRAQPAMVGAAITTGETTRWFA